MGDLLAEVLANLTPTWTQFLVIDLIAATTNAFNAALLARRPSHNRNYTIVGILLLAICGGIAGGVLRDVLLNVVPSALVNPWYIFMSGVAAALALYLDQTTSQRVREGMFRFMAAFSLPWFAVVGADKALEFELPPMAAVAIGVLGATAGRFVVDIVAGVTPKHFVRSEWFVGTALVSAGVYIPLWYSGLPIWLAALISVAAGFTLRILALHFDWGEPEP
jgi:uncharacterized membrane protein YeiH